MALDDRQANVTECPVGPAAPVPAARLRAVVEGVRPAVDGGRFPAKAAIGDVVQVEADAFADGHDLLRCELRHQLEGSRRWETVSMEPLGNDRWRGRIAPEVLGRHRFVVRADIDRFGSWRRDLWANAAAGKDLAADLAVGAELMAEAARRARGADRRALEAVATALAKAEGAGPDGQLPPETGLEELGLGADGTTLRRLLGYERVAELAWQYRRPGSTASSDAMALVVEPERARFSTWYELFPRSASPDPGRPGTFADVEARLPYLERLGIDVLYLPPVHPIGRTNRKGPEGVPRAGPDDPGSPWAIGAAEGGHTAVHPQLGRLEDFERLVAAAAEREIEVALDLAFQCSPDHPWVRQHPEWFRHLPDGSIRCAENPPKRYDDIYPLDFETSNWQELWQALLQVVQFWINHGVTVFRVDNPHTKPFAFWEWLIASVKAEDPEVIFLAEAFTRPRVMEHLAKVGFSQSYTYFTWRTAKWELESYLNELTRTPVADYLRPNLWPNTPDILTEQLQSGSRAVFVHRLVLAATLCASYGIYGPAFELMEHLPRHAGSEEYARSEKYMRRHWNLERPDSLAGLVSRLNAIRRAHPALQCNDTLRFHFIDNEQLLVYSKTGGGNPVLVAVNLDPHLTQSGWVQLDLGVLGLPGDRDFVVRDLLTDGTRYTWRGSSNFVMLDPAVMPAHVFVVEGPGGGEDQ